MTCKAKSCSRGMYAWVEREATRAAVRYHELAVLTHGRGHHAVFSPSLEDLKKGPDYCEKLLRKTILPALGLEGVFLVWHPTRAGKDGQVHFDPHLQGLSFGWTTPERVKSVFEQTGWVYRVFNKKTGGGEPLREVDDYRRLLRYELGHAGIRKGRKAFISWGRCSGKGLHAVISDERWKELNRKIRLLLRTVIPDCTTCGARLFLYEIIDKDGRSRPPDTPEGMSQSRAWARYSPSEDPHYDVPTYGRRFARDYEDRDPGEVPQEYQTLVPEEPKGPDDVPPENF